MDQTTPERSKKRGHIMSRGLRFPKDQKFITGMIRVALRKETYERKEADMILKMIKPSDTVLELGAGIGFMSSLVAKIIGVKSVHAYEANPHLIPYINSVYAANGIKNATVVNAILGSKPGTAEFHVRDKLLGSSLDSSNADGVVSVETVEIVDARPVFEDVKPTVLICDIEGAEADLIPILPLENIRVAIVELHPQWIGQKGVKAVFDAMDAAGLTYWPRGSNAKVVSFRRDW